MSSNSRERNPQSKTVDEAIPIARAKREQGESERRGQNPRRSKKSKTPTRWIALLILLFFIVLRAFFFSPSQQNVFLESSSSKQVKVWDKAFEKYFPEPEASLLSGILFGTKATMPKDFFDALKVNGTLHMIAASGYNITIVAAFTMLLAGLISRKLAIILTIFVIFLYSYLTGFEPPIIRAAFMGDLTFLAQLLGRKSDALWTLFLAAAILLLMNPFYLTNISFQLSFLATFGILYIEPLIRNLLAKLPEILKTDLSVTISAQLITIPISLYHFGTISLIAPVSNFLLAWIIPPIMFLGAFSTLIFLLNIPILDRLIAILTFLPLSYFVQIVKITGSLPFASVSFEKQNILICLGLYLILFSVIIFLKQNSPKLV